MMNKIGVFYTNQGRILGIQSGSEQEIEARSTIISKSYVILDSVENISIENNFINSRGEIDKKNEYNNYKYQSNVLVGETISISKIPFNSEVTWPDGFTEIVTDGFVETTATLEGEYKFIIDHPAYFPVEVIINATS